MTSTTIYTPIAPTYLYIKQHSITKKKYYGKTTRDPYEYNGSGSYWVDHINKHGKEHIVTLWVSELYYDTSIVEVALKFSSDNDIVNSKEWANMEPENGLNGGTSGAKHTEEQNAAKSVRQTGKKRFPYKKSGKPRSDKGKPRSEEAKVNMRKSEETKANMRKPKKQVTCPHCGKTGGENGMKRYHFDKCKKAGYNKPASFYLSNTDSMTDILKSSNPNPS
jgi:hypothetical protein